ncbi:MAG: cation diffusion facilitator family transporter [Aquamicrobium sp.]|uniref:cation diffusion facilitator family transporter n=1 Tax=Aquamicrobium sp. TaxID=1872579 RepID=UPI00349E7331|nr:cation diffusion facilitator family transporter [Aquamicrobium sp.]
MPHDHHSHDHDHDHDHDHSHAPAVTGDNERKVLVAFFIIFSFMIVEAVGGYLSGSLALLADAGHMLTDAVALALAYAAFRFGRRAADARRTFGYARFEVIAGFINAITLFGIVVWIVYEAVQRFRHPVEILSGPMLAVAVAGLLVNVFVLWLLTRGDTEHVNIKGAALHVMGDLLGSVGAIVAALVIRFTGWMPIDPILSVLVSVLILRSAWKLLAKSGHILLEGAPDNAAPQEIERHLMEAVPGVATVSHVHVWLISSGRALATLHVRPAPGAEPRAVVEAVEHALAERFAIGHATIAIDWSGDEAGGCALSRGESQEPHGHEHGADTGGRA